MCSQLHLPPEAANIKQEVGSGSPFSSQEFDDSPVAYGRAIIDSD